MRDRHSHYRTGVCRPAGSWGRRIALIVGALALAIIAPAASSRGKSPATKNAEVVAARGMVASAHALASQAGVDIMKAGGNAIDAAVAAAFAIGVVEPNASGLGGEGMMVLCRADKKWTVAIDYKSTAPAGAKYSGAIPATGHAAVAVPGTVAGLASALQQYGTMRLDQVMAPAIKLAENGFTIGPTLAGAIAENFAAIMKNPPLAALFCPDGLPLEAGATLKNPDLADSLRMIAEGGADVFYKGELADAIAAEMAQRGGFITKADLAGYRAVSREPVRGSYRGYELISAPPPVGGMSVIEIMQILDRFDVSKHAPLSPENVHLMSEAMKRGFADFNAYVADPDFEKIPVPGLLAREYARKRAADIKLDAITPKVNAGEPGKHESGSTTSLCAADRKGNVAVVTQTLSDFFGAKVAVEGTGIILNNEMRNFSSRGVNAMAPGKRMRTTIAPTIILKGDRTFAALGTPGAARIISTMAILISNLIDRKMSMQVAIETPRFFARDTDANLSVEGRMPQSTIEALTKLGYQVQKMGDYDLFFGGAQGIVIDARTGKKSGGADPRRDGAVIGY